MSDRDYRDLTDEELRDQIREAEEIIDLVKDRPEQSGALEHGAREMLDELKQEQQRRAQA